MFETFFDAVLDGVKLALCWFANFMAELVLLAFDGLLVLFPDGIVSELDIDWLASTLSGFNELFALQYLLAMCAAYLTWYLLFISARTVIKFVPFIG